MAPNGPDPDNEHASRRDAHRAPTAGGDPQAPAPFVEPPSQGNGELQELVDVLYARKIRVTNLDLITQAEIRDVEPDTLEVVNLLPSGSYFRHQMVDQLNSIITAHGWASELGTVE
jgi:hypothetical protein